MVVFTDGRSKRVIFLAHCLLNQNAISDGTAVSPASFQAVIRLLLDAEVGIVQMPCPELCCLGLDRGNIHGADSPVTVENTRIRESLGQDGPRRQLEGLADQVVHQILEYRNTALRFWALSVPTAPPPAGWRPPPPTERRSPDRAFSCRRCRPGWPWRGSPSP